MSEPFAFFAMEIFGAHGLTTIGSPRDEGCMYRVHQTVLLERVLMFLVPPPAGRLGGVLRTIDVIELGDS